MTYVLPKMQKLRYDTTDSKNSPTKLFNLFLTSSTEEVTNTKIKGGYLYNLFEDEKNVHHFNARIRYYSGTPRDSMFFEITDLVSKDTLAIITANQPFTLQTGPESNNFQWLFRVNDMRATNTFHWKHIYGFIAIFILCVYLRIMLFSRTEDKIRTISVLELSVYIVVFCYAVVRLILIWRMSTFPPIGNIDPTVFYRLRGGLEEARKTFTYLIIGFLPCFFMLISLVKTETHKKVLNRVREAFAKIKSNRVENSKISEKIRVSPRMAEKYLVRIKNSENWFIYDFWYIIALYTSLLGVCYAISKSGVFFSRFTIIPIPVLLFFLFYNWIKNKHEQENRRKGVRWVQKIIIVLSSIAFFALLDAGFSVIFLCFWVINSAIVTLWFRESVRINRIFDNINISDFFRFIVCRIPSFLILIAVYCFLKYQGDIILSIFENIGFYLLLAWAVLMAVLVCCIVFARKWIRGLIKDLARITRANKLLKKFKAKEGFAASNKNKKIKVIRGWALLKISVLSLILAYGLVKGIIPLTKVTFSEYSKTYTPVSDYLNEDKIYIKYRAKAQQTGVYLRDILKESNFKSKDMTYILRSTHNQWFINEYNAVADSNKNHWAIQPHFDQGSTYLTQPTDLVIVRYLIAEHGRIVLLCLMGLLLILLLIYIFDVRLRDTQNYTMLGIPVLLFVIALFVCLSANNKIVFFGQDFPFLSLISRIAIFFPVALLTLGVCLRIFHPADSDYDDYDNDVYRILSDRDKKVLTSAAILFVFAVCVWKLPQKTISAEENKSRFTGRFDVSNLIKETEDSIAVLNRQLQLYQYHKLDNSGASNVAALTPRDNIWRDYKEDTVYGKKWRDKFGDTDTSKTTVFFKSLLAHFDTTAKKSNPDELLHLRRRNGYLNLVVNRKYYFIPSFRQKSNEWEGHLKAAKIDKVFSLKTLRGDTIRTHLNELDLNLVKGIKNINGISQISNITLMRLDSSWTADRAPIYLIIGEQEGSSQQYYNIFADTSGYSKQGSAAKSQLAVRLLPNDQLTVKGEDGRIFNWKYGESADRFLAKNIWLNGSQRLFYPLGRESMWTYHFANLAFQTYSNSSFKDSTIHISIDYDLTKKLYDIVNSDNKMKSGINDTTRSMLENFKDLGYSEKTRDKMRDKKQSFYFDTLTNRVNVYSNVVKNKNDLEKGADHLNRKLGRLLDTLKTIHKGKKLTELSEGVNTAINAAIDSTIEKKYDYSAVILDGNGRIRALFDYSRLSRPDPNNIQNFRRFQSNMYGESSRRSEMAYFGNQSLRYIVPGPGSSIKPVVYTAVTSQAKIDWNNLNLSNPNPVLRKHEVNGKTTEGIASYGGVDFDSLEIKEGYWRPSPWTRASGLRNDGYLVHSNNLYHSVVILLGTQRSETLRQGNNMGGLLTTSRSFPVLNYGGEFSFAPDNWFGSYNTNRINLIRMPDKIDFRDQNTVLNRGMDENFRLDGRIDGAARYNAFGNEEFLKVLYDNKESGNSRWVYPDRGSLNNIVKNNAPFIRNGFVQMTMGGYPLEVSPLQIAALGMRLATLNRIENEKLTTLDDDAKRPQKGNFRYEPFKIDDSWKSSNGYVNFYKNQVLGQLRQVPLKGTAADVYKYDSLKRKMVLTERRLTQIAKDMEAAKYNGQAYYLYAKTGTLNIREIKEKDNDELKSFLVIISDTELEKIKTIDELQKVNYYTLYLMLHGVKENYSPFKNYEEVIKATLNSEQFKRYMKEKDKKI